MQLSLTDNVLWGVTALLELLVCAYALRRRLYRRLPLFTSYTILLFVREISLWLTYRYAGYTSQVAFYYYWGTQGMLVAARGLVIVELSWRVLREYRGIWALSWRLLLSIFTLLLLIAAWDAYGNTYWIAPFILTAERGLELAGLLILLTLLLLGTYYGVRLESVERMIIGGLTFYSAVLVVNNTVHRAWHTEHFALWNGIRMVSFHVAMIFWWLALRKPLPAAAPTPALLPRHVYDEISPRVNARLRALNQRLLEMLKP